MHHCPGSASSLDDGDDAFSVGYSTAGCIFSTAFVGFEILTREEQRFGGLTTNT